MNPLAMSFASNEPYVSIRTRPEGRGNPDPVEHDRARALVSIRTRPEGRVNHVAAGMIETIVEVSIRTRPEGRVNRWWSLRC